jgi:protein-L-isoaspartate(D-aspartate) O-methyltransferase
MVDRQLRARGILDARVLDAMHEVPREAFAAGADLEAAYRDGALPIGAGQTISQPYMVARMLELLELGRDDRVLEVGTGLGYQAAVLSRIAREVVTVERIPELAAQARAILASIGATNVRVVVGDGSVGFPAGAPYDAIVVAAAAPAVPASLEAQLVPGGRLLVPVGGADQTLVLVRKGPGGGTRREWFDRCIFVPLVGREGFEGPPSR